MAQNGRFFWLKMDASSGSKWTVLVGDCWNGLKKCSEKWDCSRDRVGHLAQNGRFFWLQMDDFGGWLLERSEKIRGKVGL